MVHYVCSSINSVNIILRLCSNNSGDSNDYKCISSRKKNMDVINNRVPCNKTFIIDTCSQRHHKKCREY